jgi:hypothetical protein
MFQVNEVKKWAKPHKISIKKAEDGYVWFEENNKEIVSTPAPIGQVAKEIFNKITNDKFLEYQKNYSPLESI